MVIITISATTNSNRDTSDRQTSTTIEAAEPLGVVATVSCITVAVSIIVAVAVEGVAIGSTEAFVVPDRTTMATEVVMGTTTVVVVQAEEPTGSRTHFIFPTEVTNHVAVRQFFVFFFHLKEQVFIEKIPFFYY